MMSYFTITFINQSADERIFKIGEHLAKLLLLPPLPLYLMLQQHLQWGQQQLLIYLAHVQFAVALSSPKKGKGSPYSITKRRVPELILVLGSQPAGDVSHKPGGRLPLLSARPAVTQNLETCAI